jgi:hypothetical protein
MVGLGLLGGLRWGIWREGKMLVKRKAESAMKTTHRSWRPASAGLGCFVSGPNLVLGLLAQRVYGLEVFI